MASSQIAAGGIRRNNLVEVLILCDRSLLAFNPHRSPLVPNVGSALSLLLSLCCLVAFYGYGVFISLGLCGIRTDRDLGGKQVDTPRGVLPGILPFGKGMVGAEKS